MSSSNNNEIEFIKTRLKDFFISSANSNLILQKAFSDLSEIFNKKQLYFNIEKYKRNLFDLQNFIFDNYFPEILKEHKQLEQKQIQNVMNILNTLTIGEIKNVITADIEKNQSSVDNNNTDNILVNNLVNKEIQTEQFVQTLPQEEHDIKNNLEEFSKFEKNIKDEYTKYIESSLNTHELKINNTLHKLQLHLENTQKQLDHFKNIDSTLTKHSFLKHYHFFSEDAEYLDEKYKFNIDLKNVKSISIKTFKLECNLYNITEFNHTIHVSEPNQNFTIKIPIGYYNITSLLNIIQTLFNETSNNDYSIYLDEYKNKVYFVCKELDYFNLDFDIDNNSISIGLLLGFTNNKYYQNNKYISENFPISNIFNDIYLKIFANDNELCKYTSTKKTFNYFTTYHLNTLFKQNFNYTHQKSDIHDFGKTIDIQNISFELVNTPINLLQFNKLVFEIILAVQFE
jgi:hypothetical protein